MASLEVGDEGGAQKTTFCHQPIFQIMSERKDHFKTKFNGDPDEPPGHAYENIGPLSSPPPGFTMPPKPRWRYTTLNIGKHQQIKGGKTLVHIHIWQKDNLYVKQKFLFVVEHCYFVTQGHAWTEAIVSSKDSEHNERDERSWYR